MRVERERVDFLAVHVLLPLCPCVKFVLSMQKLRQSCASLVSHWMRCALRSCTSCFVQRLKANCISGKQVKALMVETCVGCAIGVRACGVSLM